ncbi:hypothetical protein, partial [Halorubrum sp. Atlit-26R]|uniref:hypothetical protein n=1 Tax=Halorubrum sp. Atlit-26R TaxID=2282128 RepID=UPI001F19EB57
MNREKSSYSVVGGCVGYCPLDPRLKTGVCARIFISPPRQPVSMDSNATGDKTTPKIPIGVPSID